MLREVSKQNNNLPQSVEKNYLKMIEEAVWSKANMIQQAFLQNEENLRHLANNKLIEAYLREVDERKKKKIPLSQYAENLAAHYKEIWRKMDKAIEILKSPKQGWKINKVNNESELAVKVTGTNVQLRYEGCMETHIENLCIMIYQVNLFHHWVPFCKHSQNLRDLTPLEKTCYLSFKIPFLTERYAFFYGVGIDRIDENGSIVIYGEGITENEELLKRYEVDVKKYKTQKLVVMDLKFFVCEIRYKSSNEFIFKSYGAIDSRMPILPEWLVNAVVKQMGGFIFDKIIKQSKKFSGSVWDQEIKKDKHNPFYPWLHKRMETWSQQQYINKN